jgi:hypothetical protein
MKARIFSAMGFLALSTALLVPACAKNESSIAIRGVLTPTPDTCQVTATIDFPQYRVGVIDVALRSEYFAALLVENQLVARGDPNKLRTETSSIELYAADVQLQDAGGAPLVRSNGSQAAFTVPISGFIDQAVGGTPGLGFTDVLLVDSATSADLAKTKQPTDLVANVVLHGRTLGGNELTTGEWTFPIRACYLCLLTCPAKADDPLVPGPDCLSTAEEPKANCRVGADEIVDCRSCRNNPLCACTGK